MDTTRLSSKGQIVIPKAVRDRHGWREGTEFTVEATRDAIVLRPKRRFPATTLDEVAGCLKYDGPPVSLEEMDEGIGRAVTERYGRATKK